MDAPPAGYMRRPAASGFVAPHLVRDLVDAAETLCGTAARDRLTGLLPAGLPGPDTPVPEAQAAALHQAVRRLFPDEAPAVLWMAGQATAEQLMARQLSQRAQVLLSGAAWPIAAWLLGRWARQNAWTFAGSGTFRVLSAMEFEIGRNPLLRGAPPAQAPVCDYHAALFERLFQRLVDPRLICREAICAAAGGAACRFDFYLSPEAEGAA